MERRNEDSTTLEGGLIVSGSLFSREGRAPA
jgi:hypothetical protein